MELEDVDFIYMAPKRRLAPSFLECVFSSLMFIPCVFDNRFATLNQQNAQHNFLDIYITVLYLIFKNSKMYT